MLQRLAVFLPLFFMLSQAFSQDREHERPSAFDYNYIKFSPFSFIEIEPALQLGYEYQARKKFRVQHELGYLGLFNPAYFLFNQELAGYPYSSGGVRARTTFKLILKTDPLQHRHPDKYIGIDVMFKYLQYTVFDYQVRRMDAYWELTDIKTEKYVGAVHFVYGINEFLNFDNKITADWYVGLGLRYKYVTDNTGQVNANNVNYWAWYDTFPTRMMISVMGGMKLGFGLKRQKK